MIVHEDADVDYAAERIAWGGFAYAGQTCISVQRVYRARGVYDGFADELGPALRARSWSATRSTRRRTSAR